MIYLGQVKSNDIMAFGAIDCWHYSKFLLNVIDRVCDSKQNDVEGKKFNHRLVDINKS